MLVTIGIYCKITVYGTVLAKLPALFALNSLITYLLPKPFVHFLGQYSSGFNVFVQWESGISNRTILACLLNARNMWFSSELSCPFSSHNCFTKFPLGWRQDNWLDLVSFLRATRKEWKELCPMIRVQDSVRHMASPHPFLIYYFLKPFYFRLCYCTRKPWIFVFILLNSVADDQAFGGDL